MSPRALWMEYMTSMDISQFIKIQQSHWKQILTLNSYYIK